LALKACLLCKSLLLAAKKKSILSKGYRETCALRNKNKPSHTNATSLSCFYLMGVQYPRIFHFRTCLRSESVCLFLFFISTFSAPSCSSRPIHIHNSLPH